MRGRTTPLQRRDLGIDIIVRDHRGGSARQRRPRLAPVHVGPAPPLSASFFPPFAPQGSVKGGDPLRLRREGRERGEGGDEHREGLVELAECIGCPAVGGGAMRS